MPLLLGIDLGTSAVKASILDSSTGRCVASSSEPLAEIPRIVAAAGWCEQRPEDWWMDAKRAILSLPAELRSKIEAIGIAYQMHGLVVLGDDGSPVRPSIIWSDGRAAECGERLLAEIGESALAKIRNKPGNFTLSKLRWVRENEPQNLFLTWKVMLPGDYLAYRLTGVAATTAAGLSEMIGWDFSSDSPFMALWHAAGGTDSMLPDLVPTFGDQGVITRDAAVELGLPHGAPICYRAGDQPNNALSLNALEPGEVAATAGTSGVLFAVGGEIQFDPQERVNAFLHVNHTKVKPRYGTLLCVNGAGGFYSWVRKLLGVSSFVELNKLAENSPVGANGLLAYPYGNGAERSLGNLAPGATLSRIDVNRHTQADVARASVEGILFAMRYGADALSELGQKSSLVRAGAANMFKSAQFAAGFASLLNAQVELLETDGALGAARGAGFGSGVFPDLKGAFQSLETVATFAPNKELAGALESRYEEWREGVDRAG